MNISYSDLGWTPHFARQADPETQNPCRVTAVHRNVVDVISPIGTDTLLAPKGTSHVAVGDWILREGEVAGTVLERQSVLKRRAAGTAVAEQLIAANVTVMGIVSSCNADFNLARLERYLVLASDAGCLPLFILTKADLSEDASKYLKQAERLSSLAYAIAMDATDIEDVERLHPWIGVGETLALLGSSGVGKTTLRNALTGEAAATQGIREDDAKGRHTTTSREMIRTQAGGWLIDTPGMRALRLTDVDDGISAVFADIEEIVRDCRFSDCAHEAEPGCAVQMAIDAGELDEDRLRRWKKLLAEDRRNSETLAEARARDKGFGKMVKGVMKRKRFEQDW